MLASSTSTPASSSPPSSSSSSSSRPTVDELKSWFLAHVQSSSAPLLLGAVWDASACDRVVDMVAKSSRLRHGYFTAHDCKFQEGNISTRLPPSLLEAVHASGDDFLELSRQLESAVELSTSDAVQPSGASWKLNLVECKKLLAPGDAALAQRARGAKGRFDCLRFDYAALSEIDKDESHLFRILEVLSLGTAFQEPCGMLYDEELRAYKWSRPGWLKRIPVFTLGMFLAHLVELGCWRVYWLHHPNADPRKPDAARDQWPKPWPVSGSLFKNGSRADVIAKQWHRASKYPHAIKDIAALLTDVLQESTGLVENMSLDVRAVCECRSLDGCTDGKKEPSGVLSVLACIENMREHIRESKEASHQIEDAYECPRAIRSGLQALFATPILLLGSSLEVLLRAVANRVLSMWADWQMDELMGSSSQIVGNQDTTQTKKKKKKKNKKKKNVKASRVTADATFQAKSLVSEVPIGGCEHALEKSPNDAKGIDTNETAHGREQRSASSSSSSSTSARYNLGISISGGELYRARSLSKGSSVLSRDILSIDIADSDNGDTEWTTVRRSTSIDSGNDGSSVNGDHDFIEIRSRKSRRYHSVDRNSTSIDKSSSKSLQNMRRIVSSPLAGLDLHGYHEKKRERTRSSGGMFSPRTFHGHGQARASASPKRKNGKTHKRPNSARGTRATHGFAHRLGQHPTAVHGPVFFPEEEWPQPSSSNGSSVVPSSASSPAGAQTGWSLNQSQSVRRMSAEMANPWRTPERGHLILDYDSAEDGLAERTKPLISVNVRSRGSSNPSVGLLPFKIHDASEWPLMVGNIAQKRGYYDSKMSHSVEWPRMHTRLHNNGGDGRPASSHGFRPESARSVKHPTKFKQLPFMEEYNVLHFFESLMERESHEPASPARAKSPSPVVFATPMQVQPTALPTDANVSPPPKSYSHAKGGYVDDMHRPSERHTLSLYQQRMRGFRAHEAPYALHSNFIKRNRLFMPPTYSLGRGAARRTNQSSSAKSNARVAPPWLLESKTAPEANNSKAPSTQQLLHEEINSYVNHIDGLTNAKRVLIDEAIEQVRSVVCKIWETASVRVYGSYGTNLWLPCSDVDLVITGAKMQVDRTQDSNKDEAALSAVRSSIYRLARELQDRDGASRTRWITSLKVIPSAKVPLIKLTVENNIMIDMTFAVELTSHVHNGLQSAHLIRYYMQRLPELRPLTLVLKQFLFEKGLSQSYTGGLSSYCLVLLIVTFLQCMEQVQRNGERSKKPGAEHRTATRSPGFSVVRRKSVNVNIMNGPMALQSCSHQSASIMISAKLKSNTEKPETRVPSSAPASPALSHVIASPPELDFMRTLDESSSEDSSVLCSDNNHLQTEDMQTRVEGRPNLGRLLIALLSFYGSFDFQKMGICPQLNAEQGGACYYRLPQPTTSLVISDPLDPLTSLDPMLAQNIGSGIFAMYRVKAAFHWASSILCASFSVPFRPDKRSAATVSLLSRVIDGPRAAPE